MRGAREAGRERTLEIAVMMKIFNCTEWNVPRTCTKPIRCYTTAKEKFESKTDDQKGRMLSKKFCWEMRKYPRKKIDASPKLPSRKWYTMKRSEKLESRKKQRVRYRFMNYMKNPLKTRSTPYSMQKYIQRTMYIYCQPDPFRIIEALSQSEES